MRALVTGGNRYIGRDLVFVLAEQGHEVTVINSHESPLPQGAKRIHADRREPGAFEAALSDHRDDYDVIFDNTAYTPANVQPMVDLFRGRVQHYVFTSALAVYRREFLSLPVTEDYPRFSPDITDRRLGYNVGKVQCEDLLMAEFSASGFPATCFRMGHSMGPRCPVPKREPFFFARFDAGRPILIPGEGWPIVQFLHINDAARCMASTIGNERAKGEIYNMSGTDYASSADVVRIMGRAAGVEAQLVHVPMERARKQQPRLLHWGEAFSGSVVMSIDKTREHLGWEPNFNLETGFRDAHLWWQREGRDQFDIDFSADDALLAELGS